MEARPTHSYKPVVHINEDEGGGQGAYQCAIPAKEELCDDNVLLLEAYDHLNAQWIGADRLMALLCQHISQAVFCDGKPVVEQVIRKGLEAYAVTLRIDAPHYYPHERLSRLLMASFHYAFILCRFKVIDAGRGESWSLSNDQPFCRWGRNRRYLRVVQADENPGDLAIALYAKVTPKNIQLAMRRFQHESTILVGALDNRH